jgi:hypothetical protein
MRFSFFSGMALIAALPLCAQTTAQTPEAVQADLKLANEKLGLPPRAAPTDYQAQGKAGEITIAAEFAGHSVPTPEGPLSDEEYVVVEAAFFGPAGAKLQLTEGDFSLRINGNKKVQPSDPYGMVVGSVKDPEWEPAEKHDANKTSFGGSSSAGTVGGAADGPPAPPKVPFEIQRKLSLRVRKASMPVGDRTLPEAGLLYFKYRGKEKGIHTLELIYSGAAGQATIPLHP